MSWFRDRRGIVWPKVIGLVSFALFLLAIVGELLDWWDQFGEALGVSSIVITFLAGFWASNRDQIDDLTDEVREGFVATLSKLGRLDKLDKLDRIDATLDAHTELLRDIRDALRERR